MQRKARLPIVAAAILLSGFTSAAAQVGMPSLGQTSPLGMGVNSPVAQRPNAPVGQTGIPMGATELTTPGVSPGATCGVSSGAAIGIGGSMLGRPRVWARRREALAPICLTAAA